MVRNSMIDQSSLTGKNGTRLCTGNIPTRYTTLSCVVLMFILLTACGGPKTRLAILPEDTEYWSPMEKQTLSKEKEFRQYLSRDAELYIQNDLKRLHIQRLRDTEGHEIVVEIFEMKPNTSLGSLYNRYKSLSNLNLGEESSASPGFAVFYYKHYFVKVYAQKLYTGSEKDLQHIAYIIDKKIKTK